MSVSRRDLYGSRIQSYLFSKPGLSRADLADLLQVDRGNVTRLVRELTDQGIVKEGEAEESVESSAGRRKIPLFLDDDVLCVLGVEVQESWIVIRGVTVYGRIVSTGRHSLGAGSEGGQALVSVIARSITTEVTKLSALGRRVLGVGIGISGLADPSKGLVLFSEHMGVGDQPLNLREPLEELLQVPVVIDNDAKCCCYDVMTYGGFSDRRDFVYLFCELEEDGANPQVFSRVGIGSALVLGGQVHYGAHSAAGEFRSIFAPPGVRGQFGLPVAQAIKRVRSDLRGRTQVLSELSQHLGFLSNYLDLEAIYLGGGIEQYEAEMRPLLENAIRSTWLYQDLFSKPLGIHFAANGDKPAVRGAAALIARKLFLV